MPLCVPCARYSLVKGKRIVCFALNMRFVFILTMSLFYEGFFRSLIPFFHPFSSKLYTFLQHSHPPMISFILSILQQYVAGEYHPPYFVHLLGLLPTLFYLLFQNFKNFLPCPCKRFCRTQSLSTFLQRNNLPFHLFSK